MHEKGKFIVKHSQIYTPTMESNVVFFVAIDCIHSYKYHQVSIVYRPKQTDRQTDRQKNKLSPFDDFFLNVSFDSFQNSTVPMTYE